MDVNFEENHNYAFKHQLCTHSSLSKFVLGFYLSSRIILKKRIYNFYSAYINIIQLDKISNADELGQFHNKLLEKMVIAFSQKKLIK